MCARRFVRPSLPTTVVVSHMYARPRPSSSLEAMMSHRLIASASTKVTPVHITSRAVITCSELACSLFDRSFGGEYEERKKKKKRIRAGVNALER